MWTAGRATAQEVISQAESLRVTKPGKATFQSHGR